MNSLSDILKKNREEESFLHHKKELGGGYCVRRGENGSWFIIELHSEYQLCKVWAFTDQKDLTDFLNRLHREPVRQTGSTKEGI